MTAKRHVFTRRSILKAAAAATAFPYIVPSSVRGAGNTVPPGNRVTMGFIGIGGQGGGHLTGGAWTYLSGGYAGRDDVQILAACDVLQSRREQARDHVNQRYAERFGKDSYKACEAYNDFREVLARDDIDAVLIATPIHWHGIMTIMAARAGKDVYCEKPTASTILESQAVVRTVKRYARVYQAGTQQRSEYGGKFRRACELVRNGYIGALRSVYAHRAGGGVTWDVPQGAARAVPTDLDWDLWLGPAPWRQFDGDHNAHRFGAGEINWGQHHYDIVQWGIGSDRTGPVEIVFENGRPEYRYANGVVVYGCPYPGESIGGSGGVCFVGTEGRIAVDRERIASYPAGILEKKPGGGDERLYNCNSHSGNFLDCVRTRKPAICDEETAHRAVSVLLLGDIARRLGRKIRWDPAREQLINDPGAERLLSMATRAPWQA